MIVERHTIPHLNALVGGTKILEEELCSSFRGCQATFPLKSVFFTRKVAWQSLIEVHSWALDILTPTARAKKWGNIYSCSSSGSHSNCLQSKMWKWAYHQIRNRVYHNTFFCIYFSLYFINYYYVLVIIIYYSLLYIILHISHIKHMVHVIWIS